MFTVQLQTEKWSWVFLQWLSNLHGCDYQEGGLLKMQIPSHTHQSILESLHLTQSWGGGKSSLDTFPRALVKNHSKTKPNQTKPNHDPVVTWSFKDTI
jgi:hypothetical protein